MKTITLRLSFLLLLLQLQTFSQFAFNLYYTSASTSITCVNSTVGVQAVSSYTTGPITYSVNPPASVQNGSLFTFNSPGNYTITGSTPSLSPWAATISVFSNTISPTATLSPSNLSIACNSAQNPTLFAASSPGTNIEHQFIWNNGMKVKAYTPTVITSVPPGMHTYVLTNLLSGCTTSNSINVITFPGFPSFTLTSPIRNFTSGCVPNHTVDLNFTNANSNPPGIPLSFTILSVGHSTPYSTGPIGSYTFNFPGTYTAVVNDAGSGCQARFPFSIIQNTTLPIPSFVSMNNTITCAQPSVILEPSSLVSNWSYSWLSPGGGSSVGSSYSVFPSSITTNTLVGNYTLTIQNMNNTCQSQTVIPVYQNLFQPNALISSPTPTLTGISCLQPTLTLVNLSTSSIPPNTFPNSLYVIGLLWKAPAPAPAISNSISYEAFVPGTYTLTVKDLNNGCTSNATFTVEDNRDYPVINNPLSPGPFTLACPSNTPFIQISAFVYFTNTFAYPYDWKSAGGIIQTGTLAVNPPYGIALANVSSAGYYTLTVNNSVSGCSTSVSVGVYECVGIEENKKDNSFVSFYPNPGSGIYTILLKEETADPIKVEVYNSLSQKIKSVEMKTEEKQLILDEAPGIYFIEITKKGRRLHYSRLIKN